VRPYVANEGLQKWRVAPNRLNKQSWKADKGLHYSYMLGHVMKCYGPRNSRLLWIR
jgi:hypothetical protein